jgi:GNAT superfamily N-acetyltransferase
MRYEYTNGCNEDFIELCHMLDGYLNNAVGGEENRSHHIKYNNLNDIHNVVVAYDKDLAIGSAGFKKYDEETAELKRVYIREDYRGKGISKKIMELLEEAARQAGFTSLILETGEVLVEAIGLYRTIGYKVIPNYGQYANMEESICMKKIIN